jgi:hypothetical protein
MMDQRADGSGLSESVFRDRDGESQSRNFIFVGARAMLLHGLRQSDRLSGERLVGISQGAEVPTSDFIDILNNQKMPSQRANRSPNCERAKTRSPTSSSLVASHGLCPRTTEQMANRIATD